MTEFASASEIDVSGGGYFSASSELLAGSLTASGSTTIVEAGALWVTSVSLSAGVSLTISGLQIIGSLSNAGGSFQAYSTVNLSALEMGPGGIVQ